MIKKFFPRSRIYGSIYIQNDDLLIDFNCNAVIVEAAIHGVETKQLEDICKKELKACFHQL